MIAENIKVKIKNKHINSTHLMWIGLLEDCGRSRGQKTKLRKWE
jgi:hypothetical protein